MTGKTMHHEKDVMWKEFISRQLYNVLRRAVPALYQDINISMKPVFLETELRQINRDAPGGLLDADLLVQVFLRDGTDSWVILHTEIQGSSGAPLPERMFYYMTRIFGAHKKHPVALAILTESARRKEGSSYGHRHYGTYVDYGYNRLAISELDPDELIASNNPVDIALLAAQNAQRTQDDEIKRLSYLKELMKLAKERGFSRTERFELYVFLEWISNVNNPELKNDITNYEKKLEGEEWNMWATFAEQEWFQQGIEKGKYQEKFDMARNFLSLGVDKEKISIATGLPMQELDKIQAEL